MFSGRLGCSTANEQPALRENTIVNLTGEHASITENDHANEALTECAEPTVKAAVSLMITQQQKADLRELDYTAEQIRDMKPEDAHRVLGLID